MNDVWLHLGAEETVFCGNTDKRECNKKIAKTIFTTKELIEFEIEPCDLISINGPF